MTYKLVSAYEVPSKTGKNFGFSILLKNKEGHSLVINETFKQGISTDKIIEKLTNMITAIKSNEAK